MKKLLMLLVITLLMVGCGDSLPPTSYRNSATAYVYGSDGHYSCEITQNAGPDNGKVWIGDFQSAAAAEGVCSKIAALITQEALRAAGSNIATYR